MSDIWEESVVLALRDSQWQSKRPKSRRPEEYLALSGSPESHSADAIVVKDGRFLLFEAKGTLGNIRDEWMRESKQVEGGFSPKPVHLRVMKLVRDFLRNPDDPRLRGMMRASMQCHLFAYWSSRRGDEHDALESLLIDPYASASLQGLLRSTDVRVHRRSGFAGTDVSTCARNLDSRFQLARRDLPIDWSAVSGGVSILRLNTEDVAILDLDNGNAQLPVGLGGQEFRSYLEFLSEGVSGMPTNAVIIEKTTGFSRYIKNIDDFLSIYQPATYPADPDEITKNLSDDIGRKSVPGKGKW